MAGKNSAITARSAASTNRAGPATIPKASILRQSCIEELNAQPEDLIAEFPMLLSGEELRVSDAQYREMKLRIRIDGPST